MSIIHPTTLAEAEAIMSDPEGQAFFLAFPDLAKPVQAKLDRGFYRAWEAYGTEAGKTRFQRPNGPKEGNQNDDCADMASMRGDDPGREDPQK